MPEGNALPFEPVSAKGRLTLITGGSGTGKTFTAAGHLRGSRACARRASLHKPHGGWYAGHPVMAWRI